MPDFAIFSFVFRVFRLTLSLLRVSNPHMPTVGSGALLAILTDRQQPKKQKYSDDDYMIPPKESSLRRAVPGAGWDDGFNVAHLILRFRIVEYTSF